MIEAKDLRKSFRAVKALDGVGFLAGDGQVTGLIGPNGAGKTTALRILYTILRPDAGCALVDGFDTVADRQQVQRRIGVLPDSHGLYPRLTAREHVRYFGRLHGMDGSALEERIDELMDILDMNRFADRRAKGFSKGETRKVSLARALVHDPRNLMLDEPTNGLDIPGSRAVHALIRRMRDQGRCILFCSHIMGEVAAVCDRIVVLAAGRVAGQGTAGELLSQTGCADLEEVFLALTGDAAEESAHVA
jgi:sodium transport system ATP-binding protein